MVDQPKGLPLQQDIDASYGAYGVFIVVVICQFLNWILKSVGPPKSLRDDEWKWRNLTISWIHALICVIWCTVSLIQYPQILSDLEFFKTHSIVLLVTVSTGYFLYDFLDIALSGKMLAMWEVQLHHIAVGGMFYYNLYNETWIAFNTIALTVEVNSFFLHSRKLLQMLGQPFDSLLYRAAVYLNISTFIIFRGVPILAISWGMYNWYSRVSVTYLCCISAAMLVMFVMNPILFMRLLRSDFLRGNSRASKSKPVQNGNNNVYKSNHVKQN